MTIRSFSATGGSHAGDRVMWRMRSANSASSSDGFDGSKRANFRNCSTLRLMTKQCCTKRFVFTAPGASWRSEAEPSWYSKTVSLAKAKVSRLKSNGRSASAVVAVTSSAAVTNGPRKRRGPNSFVRPPPDIGEDTSNFVALRYARSIRRVRASGGYAAHHAKPRGQITPHQHRRRKCDT